MRVFVYGTLMRGCSNEHMMRDAAWGGPAATSAEWSLVSLGPWPAMVAGTSRVHGEVYDVPEDRLPDLDAFEDVPALYERVGIRLADGQQVQAWVMPARRARLGAIVPSGDWRDVTPTSGPARVVYDGFNRG